MIGQTLGHYRIEAKLGEGGMGVVYKARDTQPGPASGDQGTLGGGRLPARPQGPLSTRPAGRTSSPHRDLKPANIMVTDDGHVKVLDFGLAKLTESSSDDDATETLDHGPRTEEGTILGTVSYMSPEQAEGKKVGARSDIFSFGAVLYEMVTGRRAFQGETKFSTLTAIARDEPKPVSEIAGGVPQELERIIHRCLRKDPARRFQHVDDLKVALEELKEESESGSTAARVQPPRAERGKRTLWIASAALVLAIAGAAWWFLRRPARKPEAPLRIVPLTTFAGHEWNPALSPDGNQIAFVWKGEKQDNWDVYVKLIDGGTPLRLTTDPATDFGPAWAPDGRRLAFIRVSQNSRGIYVIPALGGPERKLADATAFGRLSWSRDGKWIAFDQLVSPSQPSGIFLLSVETGEKRRLTSPPEGYLMDVFPAFSPDGRTLAFERAHSVATAAVYTLALSPANAPAGEPRRITAEPRRIAVEGDRVDSPSVSKGGAGGAYRLAYFQYSYDTNIWRVPGPAVSAKDAELVARRPLDLFRLEPQRNRPDLEDARGGRPATQITKNGGHEAHESVDGKSVYYAKRYFLNSPPGIYRMPVDGGEEVRVLDHGDVGGWALTASGIYILKSRTAPRGTSIEYYNFDTGKLSEIVRFGEQMRIEGRNHLRRRS